MQCFICFFIKSGVTIVGTGSSPPRVWHSDMTHLFKGGLSAMELPHFFSLYVCQINPLFLSPSWMPPSVGLILSPVIPYFLKFIIDFFSSAAAFSLKHLVVFRHESIEAELKSPTPLMQRHQLHMLSQFQTEGSAQWGCMATWSEGLFWNRVNSSDNWIKPTPQASLLALPGRLRPVGESWWSPAWELSGNPRGRGVLTQACCPGDQPSQNDHLHGGLQHGVSLLLISIP